MTTRPWRRGAGWTQGGFVLALAGCQLTTEGPEERPMDAATVRLEAPLVNPRATSDASVGTTLSKIAPLSGSIMSSRRVMLQWYSNADAETCVVVNNQQFPHETRVGPNVIRYEAMNGETTFTWHVQLGRCGESIGGSGGDSTWRFLVPLASAQFDGSLARVNGLSASLENLPGDDVIEVHALPEPTDASVELRDGCLARRPTRRGFDLWVRASQLRQTRIINAGDTDGDGYLKVLVWQSNRFFLMRYESDCQAEITPLPLLSNRRVHAAIGGRDWDQDGRADLAFVESTGANPVRFQIEILHAPSQPTSVRLPEMCSQPGSRPPRIAFAAPRDPRSRPRLVVGCVGGALGNSVWVQDSHDVWIHIEGADEPPFDGGEIAVAGDLNGDGLRDLVYTTNYAGRRSIAVWNIDLDQPEPIDFDRDGLARACPGTELGADFGSGDLTADGHEELVVGSPVGGSSLGGICYGSKDSGGGPVTWRSWASATWRSCDSLSCLEIGTHSRLGWAFAVLDLDADGRYEIVPWSGDLGDPGVGLPVRDSINDTLMVPGNPADPTTAVVTPPSH